jgi:CRISPR-associated protein Csd1
VILQALVSLHDRLMNEQPDRTDLAPFGSSLQKIGFCVVLEQDGTLHRIETVGEIENGRHLPGRLVVPGQGKPSGQGINPCFLWDNSAYMLGFRPDDDAPARTLKCFEAFRDRHIAAQHVVNDEAFDLVCTFLKGWNPKSATSREDISTLGQSFGVFRLRSARNYVHERPAVQRYWLTQLSAVDEGGPAVLGPCLVTGEIGPLARLHEPKVKGINGAQPAGALLVSFNEEAYTSFAKTQSYNAPVSPAAVFKYTNALNYLAEGRRQRVVIGDATTVFWTEKSAPIEDWFGPAIEAKNAEDPATRDRIRAFLARLRQGKAAADEIGDSEIPFYVLGLSPNASRVSVRFWLQSTIGDLFERLKQHFDDLEIVGADIDAPPPVIRELLDETAPAKNGWADREKVPSLLTGALLRAILTGRPYPEAFYLAVLRRIRAEGFVNTDKRKDWKSAAHRRAAILKACLTRKFRLNQQPKEVPVSLDSSREDPGYRLGRWFAVLEKVQEEAYENKLNATIKDRFFSSAMATPATVFPRLIRLHQHHMRRIEHPGRRTNLEKIIQEISSSLAAFPTNLSLENQGLFAIGYYHQRQDLFTKKDTTANEQEQQQ